MNVLLIGGGGREHALAYKLAQSPMLESLYTLPGNPGIGEFAQNVPGSVSDFEAIKNEIIAKAIDMIVVGPEVPLCEGLKDYLDEQEFGRNLHFIGPDKAAAQLEGSKGYAKEFMLEFGIPTASYRSFIADGKESAFNFLATLDAPYVLKADGLAAGKGVVILDSIEEAKSTLGQMWSGQFGAAGNTIVIEEFLKGIELSVFVLTDGINYKIIGEAKDYKRIGEGDVGLNTGGMGAVSPVPFLDSGLRKKIEDQIVRPTVEGIQKRGFDYKGFVFIGLMITPQGDPKVIEYNIRMGDPETEVVMPRLKGDFLAMLASLKSQELDKQEVVISEATATTVIAVSKGYPEAYEKGKEINLPKSNKHQIIFHAGTKEIDGKLTTSGGRVLACTGLGTGIKEALAKSYDAIDEIEYEGKAFRKDIGQDLL